MVAIAEHIKVPELRFPEFSGEWERARMEQLARVNPPDMPLPNSFYYIDLDAVDKGVLKEADKIDKESAPSRAQRFLEIDDVLFQMVRPYQKNNLWFREAKGHYVASTGYAILKSKCQAFTYQLLHEPQFNRQVRVRCTGSNYPAINTSELKLIPVYHPSLPEQQKIAEFLTAVDEKIGKLKRKKELLEAYKKGAMQKLFSQEIRFKDDQGNPYPDWEEKRLGEVGSKSKRKNKANQSLPVLTNSATQGVIMQDSYFDREITTEANLDGYYVVNLGLFVYNPRISKHAKAGPINFNNAGAGLMSPLYTVFSIDEGLKSFFKEYFKTTFWHRYMMAVSNFGVRHDRMNVTSDDFFAMPLPFPSLPEQQKIAEFLTGIDDKINAVANQIDKAAEFKKGLLQKMFV